MSVERDLYPLVDPGVEDYESDVEDAIDQMALLNLVHGLIVRRSSESPRLLPRHEGVLR